MFGLTMIKDYLNEILDGSKPLIRSYPTNKRGKIALIDSRSMKIYGTIELVGCREISAKSIVLGIKLVDFKILYFKWMMRIRSIMLMILKSQRLAKPIKVEAEKHTWVEIPDNTEFYYMDSLF